MSDLLDLWISIRSDEPNLFLIQISPKDLVWRIYAKIKEMNHTRLTDLGPADMDLWKLHSSLAANNNDNFEDSIKQIDLLTQADKMIPINRVSEYFPYQPSIDHLHVIVQPRSVIQRRNPPLKNEAVADMLHRALWGTRFESLLHESPVEPSLNYIQMNQFEGPLRHFKEPILLIRDEYTEAFSAMERWARVRKGGGGAVITGQPGIGKAFFLFYALIRRLTAKLPTAFQMEKDTFFLFTEEGAAVYLANQSDMIPPGTWALADSGVDINQPCGAFLHSDESNVFVLQASSPRASRWKDWFKYRCARLYVMDHISPKELRALGHLLELDTEKLLSHFRTWGPSTRTCLNLERGWRTIESMRSDVRKAAELFVERPNFVLKAVKALEFVDDIPSILFTIKPAAQNREAQEIHIASKKILGYIAYQAIENDFANQCELFSVFSSQPLLKSSAGWIFEKFVHARLTVYPMSQPLDTTPAKPDSPPLQVPFCPEVVPLGGKSGLKKANDLGSMFYWRPTSQNFTSFDAIICTPTQIILLQATVSDTHDINREGLQTIRDSIPKNFSQNRQWCLVFITNKQKNARSLRDQPFLSRLKPVVDKQLHVYSCVHDVNQTRWTSKGREALERIMERIIEDEDRDADADAEDEDQQDADQDRDVDMQMNE